ncbi:hypothetical protein CB0940_11114 [Cercospora beticola]|uniref:Cell wall galactomannoprotein n=1 Tax=Cercospora beticola TaxID=122368 RepID=A0A2G5HEQ2_CERBT|nr:hypothetical protein CB0940_11114 [Cercospora beticola]PIA90998.1 hypothetical protein CB0940_11114 [Cercospora beticola]WPB07944.1 hypothetical protein RHO25_012608 [Cercospora beticola]CAK1368207.1 unnamed protein product [Cercospora beticola]
MRSAKILLFVSVEAASFDNDCCQLELEKALVKRTDVGDIVAGVKNITSQATILVKDIEAIDPTDVVSAVAVNSQGQVVQAAINTSVAQADTFNDISLNEGVKLIRPIHALVTVALEVINGLTSRKRFFEDVQLAPIVLDVFKTLNATARDFSDTVVGQLPKNLRASAAALTKPVFEGLDGAISCFGTEGTGMCFNVTDPLVNATVLTSGGKQTASAFYMMLSAVALAIAFVV